MEILGAQLSALARRKAPVTEVEDNSPSSITIVVSVKYLVFVMRADNRGEGGILALWRWRCSASGARR